MTQDNDQKYQIIQKTLLQNRDPFIHIKEMLKEFAQEWILSLQKQTLGSLDIRDFYTVKKVNPKIVDFWNAYQGEEADEAHALYTAWKDFQENYTKLQKKQILNPKEFEEGQHFLKNISLKLWGQLLRSTVYYDLDLDHSDTWGLDLRINSLINLSHEKQNTANIFCTSTIQDIHQNLMALLSSAKDSPHNITKGAILYIMDQNPFKKIDRDTMSADQINLFYALNQALLNVSFETFFTITLNASIKSDTKNLFESACHHFWESKKRNITYQLLDTNNKIPIHDILSK